MITIYLITRFNFPRKKQLASLIVLSIQILTLLKPYPYTLYKCYQMFSLCLCLCVYILLIQ